jgi:hypothetical protein
MTPGVAKACLDLCTDYFYEVQITYSGGEDYKDRITADFRHEDDATDICRQLNMLSSAAIIQEGKRLT